MTIETVKLRRVQSLPGSPVANTIYLVESGSGTFTMHVTNNDGTIEASSLVVSPPPVTVANLPAAGTAGTGAKRFVSDANATTFASIVAGGGANNVPVYSDGTNWRIG